MATDEKRRNPRTFPDRKILYGFAGDGEGTVVNKQPAGELGIP
jgi:hypothetical protein